MLSSGTSPRLKLVDFGDAVQITDSPYFHELNGSSEFCGKFCIYVLLVSLIVKLSDPSRPNKVVL